MPENYFQIQLSVKPKEKGEAELVPPKVLQDLNYSFVVVKEGGEEGIVNVDEPDEVIKKIEKDKNCKRLTAKQMETLQKSYPSPRIKRKYRMLPLLQAGKGSEQFKVDDKGDRVVDTFQTVRSGFYLIDVPILAQN
jgi:hypothetical protein